MPFVYVVLGLMLLTVLIFMLRLTLTGEHGRSQKMKSSASSDLPNESSTPLELDSANVVREHLYEAEPLDQLCSLKTGFMYAADCREALEVGKLEGVRWAACWLDIDGFRVVNSVKGMSIGDYFIVNLVSKLKRIFPVNSLITRVSADHFSIWFPLSGESEFQKYADEISGLSKKISFEIGAKYELRICVGVCITGRSDSAYDYDTILQKANIAWYCIKNSKAEQYAIYNLTMVKTYLYGNLAMDYADEYEHEQEFSLYFTPRLDLKTKTAAAMRSIPCWCSEQLAISRYGIRLESGRLQQKTVKILYRVCKMLSALQKADKKVLPIEVYIPLTELFKKDIAVFAAKCACESQVDLSLIVFSVDIAAFIIEPDIARAQANSLAALGAEILIEGYIDSVAKLDLLNGSNIKYIRIPRLLTTDICLNEEKAKALNSIQKKADKLEISVVYEGIDTDEQLLEINAIGGNYVDGKCAGGIYPDNYIDKALYKYTGDTGN